MNPLPGVDINNPTEILSNVAMNQQKRIIWTGALEWTEKPKTEGPTPPMPNARVTRSLACNVSLAPTDPEV